MGWKGRKVREIGGNYSTMANISQSKEGTKGCQEKKRQEPGMKSMGSKRFGPQIAKPSYEPISRVMSSWLGLK